MKNENIIAIAIACLIIAAAIVPFMPALAGQFRDFTGGYTTNITTEAVSISFGGDAVREITIAPNGGTNDVVFFAMDCRPVDLATAVSNNTATPIRGNRIYLAPIYTATTNICLQANAGTISVDITAK